MPIDSEPDTPDSARATAADAESRDARDEAHRPDTHDVSARPDARDIRNRQLAAHIRQRQFVDASYQNAPLDAWTEAVPKLRAAWEDHKQRYPERSQAMPRTQPDGSWVIGGDRRLSPEQNAEASKCCADLRDEADRVILPAMRRVEAADPGRHLAGLEHMLKGEDRLKEKIAVALEAPGITVSEALDLVPDVVRFTLKYGAERYADGVSADVERLQSEGFELVKVKNLWHADQYKGVNSQWRRPDTGLRFEVQFHTAESIEAKELTHEAYERIRRKTTPDPELAELEQLQRRANALLATPPGADRIKNFPE